MPRMFTDDTYLIFNGPTTNELIKKINLYLINVYNWMNANHLCINAKKSSALIVNPTQKVSLSKTFSSLGILYKVKNYLPKKVLVQLYHSLFHHHLKYCNTIWSSTYETFLNTIRSLQNRVIRTIAGLERQQSCMVAYKQFNILKFDELVKIKIGHFVIGTIIINYHQFFPIISQG